MSSLYTQITLEKVYNTYTFRKQVDMLFKVETLNGRIFADLVIACLMDCEINGN